MGGKSSAPKQSPNNQSRRTEAGNTVEAMALAPGAVDYSNPYKQERAQVELPKELKPAEITPVQTTAVEEKKQTEVREQTMSAAVVKENKKKKAPKKAETPMKKSPSSSIPQDEQKPPLTVSKKLPASPSAGQLVTLPVPTDSLEESLELISECPAKRNMYDDDDYFSRRARSTVLVAPTTAFQQRESDTLEQEMLQNVMVEKQKVMGAPAPKKLDLSIPARGSEKVLQIDTALVL